MVEPKMTVQTSSQGKPIIDHASPVLDLLKQVNSTSAWFAKLNSWNFQSKECKGTWNYGRHFSSKTVLLPIGK